MREPKILNKIFRNSLGYVVAVGAVALATWLKLLAQPNIIPTDVPILYLVAIVPVAIFFGLGPSLLVCVLSFLAYDYYFIPPVQQITYSADAGPILAIFLIVGVLFSYLTSNLRRQNQVAIKEIAARKKSEAELIKYRDHLEELVQQRTSELEKANFQLRDEITERKKAEEELRQRAEELKTVMDLVPAAIWVAHDPECHNITGNKTANAFYEAEEGENVSAGPGVGEPVPPRRFFHNGRELTAEELPMQQSAALNSDVQGSEFNVLLPSGKSRTLWGSASPLRDPDGRVRGVVAAFLDITERQQAEEALKQSEEKYRNLFSNMVEEVHFWKLVRDDNGGIKTWRLVDVNPPALRTWGRQTVDEIRGKTTDEIFGPGSTEHFIPIVQKIMTENIPYSYEDYFPNLNKYFRFTSVPLGEYFITTGSDITEIKQNEESLSRYAHQLEASNKELESFSYSVSHDLRAPLRSITGFSTILLEDYSDKLDNEGKLYLKKISDSGELMGQLMDDLLKLSRVTRSDLNLEKLDLSDMARKIVDELRNEDPKRKVKVTIAPNMTANGDKNLLGLVLQNLLGNAWKYSSKTSEPRIEIGTAAHNGKRAYFVRDNGVGFDMTYADKLFQPFQRLHKATEFAGTGIGLATVQRIIRRHGGQVWAEGKVGGGATFYFTLN